MLINKVRLSKTLDAIHAAHFDSRTLAVDERGRAARWIAGRQGLPGAYAGTFAGFPTERSRGIVLFTGRAYRLGIRAPPPGRGSLARSRGPAQ